MEFFNLIVFFGVFIGYFIDIEEFRRKSEKSTHTHMWSTDRIQIDKRIYSCENCCGNFFIYTHTLTSKRLAATHNKSSIYVQLSEILYFSFDFYWFSGIECNKLQKAKSVRRHERWQIKNKSINKTNELCHRLHQQHHHYILWCIHYHRLVKIN